MDTNKKLTREELVSAIDKRVQEIRALVYQDKENLGFVFSFNGYDDEDLSGTISITGTNKNIVQALCLLLLNDDDMQRLISVAQEVVSEMKADECRGKC